MYDHDDTVIGKAYDSRLMRRLLAYLRPYKRLVALSIGLTLAISGLELLGPFLTKIAIDRYMATGNLAGLNLIAALFIAALLFIFCLEYLQTYITHQIGQRVMYDLRMQIFSHVQRLDVSYFDSNPVGRIMTRITSDVDALNELFTAGVVTIFGDVFTLAGIVGALLLLNWKLALVTFSVLPFIFIITFVFRIKAREAYRWVRSCVARMNAFLQESLSGMSVIQLFTQERRKFSEFDEINREHLRANLQSILYYAAFYPAMELIGAISIALVIWYGGGQAVQGMLTIGALVAFIQYADRFFQPISDLTEKYNILQTAMASSERIFALLAVKPTIVSPERALPVPERCDIDFKDVWFAYKPGEYVLKGVSFSVREGERVAIVGATGAGKTTITSLLLRFYDVERGSINIGGTDIRRFDLEKLRSLFGIVLQDVFLFSGTVEANLRLGNVEISSDRVRRAAQTVHADKFIARLPRGFDQELRERGNSLSVGEKQLLAFARALAYDPKILILDEATSSIDTETELLIRNALRKLMKGRTAIIIAHRLSTVRDVDRIIVLHRGEVREMGTHRELLKLRGIYYRLYQIQYKDQRLPSRARRDETGAHLPPM